MPISLIKMKIDGITHEGWGVARLDGMAVFVEGAIPGETVMAGITEKGRYFMRARAQEVLEPSEYRAVPFCPHYGECGGCNLQHVTYEGQLAFKRRMVEDAFRRLGGIKEPDVLPVLGMEDPMGYRNKAEFRVWKSGTGVYSLGFRMRNSHAAVAITECRVLQDGILEAARFAVEEMNDSLKGEYLGTRHMVVRANPEGKLMVTLVSSEPAGSPHRKLAMKLLEKVPMATSVYHCFNRSRFGEVLQGGFTLLAGLDKLTFGISGSSFDASPRSFLQVNSRQVGLLYETAAGFAGIKDDDDVLDVFSGMGTIALMLAKRARKALGIELNGFAVADARASATKNGIDNAYFIAGLAEEVISSDEVKAFGARVAVLDPPRAGCAPGLVRALVESAVERISYVSCDPATLARDVSLLISGGFDLRKVQPVDMFPHTSHIETVISLSRADV
ncbi:MAG TPA: 23S rRNA (uracil(1939)-C(5))-methyltransferase RlmD [Bacillota bacterium]|nr:23S rRNA (uracil(1939)-C(5))-methyltransferase RlmD [Bacillota bacterium]